MLLYNASGPLDVPLIFFCWGGDFFPLKVGVILKEDGIFRFETESGH